jgi:hypothetical protein
LGTEIVFTQSEFEKEFGPKLGTSNRWGAFLTIAGRLSRLERAVNIGETGCVRDENGWIGNGNSTMMWEWIGKKTGGDIFSIDISPDNVNLARRIAPRVNYYRNDSVHMLSHPELDVKLRHLDLLYLDSYDHNPPFGLSELHHAGELAACYERLPSGCMIAIDDCHGEDSGKHFLVNQFFKRMKIPPLLTSYVFIWVKP